MNAPILCLGLASVIVACAGTPRAASLADGEYELVVEQSYRAGCDAPAVPDTPIADRCYDAASPGVTYTVVISEHGSRVAIGEARGSIDPAHAGAFVLDMFAGGRLRVSGGVAELTVFGSGVPVVKSERGRFHPHR